MILKHLTLLVSVTCISLTPARLFAADGYFRVEQRAGIWWFVTPSGELTISAGVNNVSYRGDVIHGTTVHPYFDGVSKLYPSERQAAYPAKMDELFAAHQLILLPCTPVARLAAGADHSQTRSRLLRYTSPFSLAGVLTIAIPCPHGGMQLAAQRELDEPL